MNHKPLIFLAWLLTLSPAVLLANVHEYSFDNGLKLIVKEDHRAPVVVSQVWYRIGSSYERPGLTGISHALEHMMFKGTDKLAPGEFSRIISANGGRENAFTGRDYTAYFQTLEKSRLPISFELEADRMRNLTLPGDEFLKEIEVVKEERRLRTDDKPQSYTGEVARATAFQTSPYRHPVIGWMSDLDNMTIGDLKAWYQKWYAPNNATVVVVGDVNPEEVYQLARTHFAPLKPEQISVPVARPEVEQQGIKRITVKRPAELPYLIMAYKVPSLTPAVAAEPGFPEHELYALEVLAGILDGGNSARFSSRLVRGSEIAAGVGAGYNLASRLDGLFSIGGTPSQGRTSAELEQAIRAELEELKQELVSPAELERVKAQVVSSDVYEKDSIFYQGMIIGLLETIGLDWRLADEYVAKVQAVSAEQVRDVARKYFIDDRLTVAVLDPQPITEAPRPPAGGIRHAQ
ncbi:MAG: insulinase family protein [Thiotrichales bacterium]|nr:insulinase family protein [Thiotrichales bacterium]